MGRTSLFQTITKLGDKYLKLIIDSGSSLNVVAKSAVASYGLKSEPHPQPVAWIDKTSVPVTERCLVPLHLGSYQESVWGDVLPMDVAHILLGRPWLYDHDITRFGRSNTYVFMHGGKKMVLKPVQPKPPAKSNTKGASKPKELIKTLHLLAKKQFEHESKSVGIIYALVAIEVRDAPVSKVPREVSQVISDLTDLRNYLTPPLRDIQHAIDLIPVAPLPNLSKKSLSKGLSAGALLGISPAKSNSLLESLKPCPIYQG